MMDATEATEAQKNLTYPLSSDFPDKPSYNEARAEYHEQLSEISGQFRAWLGQTYASDLPGPVRDLIFGKAWEDGHSSGYHEIEGHYVDYADFACEVRRYK